MARPRSPLSRLVALAVALLLLWVPVAAAATAGFAWAAIACCCGDHAGDEACGCPDCPSAEHAQRRDRAPDRESRVRSCAPEGTLTTPAQPAPCEPVSTPSALAPRVLRVEPPPLRPPPPAPSYEPRTPPF